MDGLSTPRQLRDEDVLAAISAGADGAVKVHVKHLLKKLHLRPRVEAAVWMINQQ